MNRCLIRYGGRRVCQAGFVISSLLAFLTHAAKAASADAPALAEIRPILQAHYVDFDNLSFLPNDRLDDLVARAQGEILVQDAQPKAAEVPSICLALPNGPLYCRFATFTLGAGWADLTSKLRAGLDQNARGVILDLRNTADPDAFAGAARVAGFFVPPGLPLFTLRRSPPAPPLPFVSADPVGGPLRLRGPLVVLLNGGTAGAGEALAAALKAKGALTVGRWTSGNGAQFEDHPLASGRTLRYVSGQVTMADGTPLWRHSVEPDIGLLVDAKKEAAALDLIAQGRILEVIHELPGSHRLSEAALVQGEDPGVEAYLVPHGKASPQVVAQDSTLVAALDSLKAIQVSQEALPAARAGQAQTVPVAQ